MRMSAASNILRDMFVFGQILNRAAFSHHSSLWGDPSIRNALGWADYCQELSKQIKGQLYEEDVNSQLSQMTVFLDPVSCLKLSVDSLGCAKTLLLEAWMSNPTFQPLLQKKIGSFLQENSDDIKVWEEVQQNFSDSNKCLQVCTDLLNTLTSKSDVSFLQNFRSDYQAKALLQNLVAAVHNVNNVHRRENYLCAVYEKLTETQEGWNILVSLFTADVYHLTCDEALTQDRVLTLFLKQMTETIKLNGSDSLLWNLPIDTLVKASCASEQFFLTYLDALIALGDSFSPQIDDNGFIIWRSQHGHTLNELCLHFQRQLESAASLSQDRKARTLGAVTERVKGTDFTVWKELVRNLLQLLKQG